MRKQYVSQTVTFRFRRWSRKGYAAFISIHRSVSIGQLASNLAERFYTKNNSNQTGLVIQSCAGKEEEAEDPGLLPVAGGSVYSLLLLILSTLLLPQVAEVSAPAGQPIFVNEPDSGKYLFNKGTSRYLFI